MAEKMMVKMVHNTREEELPLLEQMVMVVEVPAEGTGVAVAVVAATKTMELVAVDPVS